MTFIGQYYDAGSSLNYLQKRYYNSSQGQFLSEDPLFLGIPKLQILTDPQSLNAYSYSQDNPIIKEDPTGLTSAIIPGQGLVYDYNGTNESVCCSTFSTYQYLQNPSAAQSNSGSHPSPSNLFNTSWTSYNYNQSRNNGIVTQGGGNTPAGAAATIGILGAGTGIGMVGDAALGSVALDCAIDCDVANYLAQIATKGAARAITTIGQYGSLTEGIGEDTTLAESQALREAAETAESSSGGLDSIPWSRLTTAGSAVIGTGVAAAVIENLYRSFFGQIGPYDDQSPSEGP